MPVKPIAVVYLPCALGHDPTSNYNVLQEKLGQKVWNIPLKNHPLAKKFATAQIMVIYLLYTHNNLLNYPVLANNKKNCSHREIALTTWRPCDY